MGPMRKIAPLSSVPAAPEWEGRVGRFSIEVHGGEEHGSLLLVPPQGEPIEIRLDGGRMSIRYAGPEVLLHAPDARIEMAGRSIALTAEEDVQVHGGREVDIHSGIDVEVRADHHVNLWGHGVEVGD